METEAKTDNGTNERYRKSALSSVQWENGMNLCHNCVDMATQNFTSDRNLGSALLIKNADQSFEKQHIHQKDTSPRPKKKLINSFTTARDHKHLEFANHEEFK